MGRPRQSRRFALALALVLVTGPVAAAFGQSPADANGATRETVQALQQRILSDPKMASAVQTLSTDPNVQAILADPALTAALARGDIAALLADPKIRRLADDPAVQDLSRQVDQ